MKRAKSMMEGDVQEDLIVKTTFKMSKKLLSKLESSLAHKDLQNLLARSPRQTIKILFSLPRARLRAIQITEPWLTRQKKIISTTFLIVIIKQKRDIMRVANMKIEISNLIQKKSTTKILSTRTRMLRRVRQVPSSKITTAEKTRSLSHKFRQKKKNNKTLKLRILIMNVKIEEVAVKSTKNVTMYKKTKWSRKTTNKSTNTNRVKKQEMGNSEPRSQMIIGADKEITKVLISVVVSQQKIKSIGLFWRSSPMRMQNLSQVKNNPQPVRRTILQLQQI